MGKRGPKKGTKRTRESRDKLIAAVRSRQSAMPDMPAEKFVIGYRAAADVIRDALGRGPSASSFGKFMGQDNLGSVKVDRRGRDVSHVGSGTGVGVRCHLWMDTEPEHPRGYRASDWPKEGIPGNAQGVFIVDDLVADWSHVEAFREHQRSERLKHQASRGGKASARRKRG